MATVYFKVKESFLVGDKDGQEPILDQFKSAPGDTIQLSILRGPGRAGLGFEAGPHNLEEGDLSISAEEEGLQVNVEGIFKVSLKPDYEEDFFNQESKWQFTGIAEGEFGPNLLGEVKEGLEEETYEFKNRMGSGTAIRHLMQVTTSDSKKFS